MSQSENPFRAPQIERPASPQLRGGDAQVESYRRTHVAHEAAVRACALPYFLAAALWGLGALVMAVVFVGLARTDELGVDGSAPFLVACLIQGGLALACAMGGVWLRRLDGRARPIVRALSGVGVLCVPAVFTNIYILRVVFHKKGDVVFSPWYKEAIRRTPHIRSRPSRTDVFVLYVLPVLTILGVAGWLAYAIS